MEKLTKRKLIEALKYFDDEDEVAVHGAHTMLQFAYGVGSSYTEKSDERDEEQQIIVINF